MKLASQVLSNYTTITGVIKPNYSLQTFSFISIGMSTIRGTETLSPVEGILKGVITVLTKPIQTDSFRQFFKDSISHLLTLLTKLHYKYTSIYIIILRYLVNTTSLNVDCATYINRGRAITHPLANRGTPYIASTIPRTTTNCIPIQAGSYPSPPSFLKAFPFETNLPNLNQSPIILGDIYILIRSIIFSYTYRHKNFLQNTRIKLGSHTMTPFGVPGLK